MDLISILFFVVSMYKSYTEGIVDDTLNLLAAICSACIVTALILAFHGNFKHMVEARNRLLGDLCDRSALESLGKVASSLTVVDDYSVSK